MTDVNWPPRVCKADVGAYFVRIFFLIKIYWKWPLITVKVLFQPTTAEVLKIIRRVFRPLL